MLKIIIFLIREKKILFSKSDAIAANYAKAAGFKREIDWAHYEANVSKPGFVADFKVSFPILRLIIKIEITLVRTHIKQFHVLQ